MASTRTPTTRRPGTVTTAAALLIALTGGTVLGLAVEVTDHRLTISTVVTAGLVLFTVAVPAVGLLGRRTWARPLLFTGIGVLLWPPLTTGLMTPAETLTFNGILTGLPPLPGGITVPVLAGLGAAVLALTRGDRAVQWFDGVDAARSSRPGAISGLLGAIAVLTVVQTLVQAPRYLAGTDGRFLPVLLLQAAILAVILACAVGGRFHPPAMATATPMLCGWLLIDTFTWVVTPRLFASPQPTRSAVALTGTLLTAILAITVVVLLIRAVRRPDSASDPRDEPDRRSDFPSDPETAATL